MLKKLNQNLQYVLPRSKYLYRHHKNLRDKIILTFRLIILLFLKIFKKIYIFNGYFGGESFKIYLDLEKGKHGSRGYFLLREKQEPILEFGHKFIKEGDVVIDCGSNQGVFSLSFKSKIKNTGLIFCIEPFTYAIKKLKKNFILNKYKNYYIYKNIVSDKLGLAKIYYSEGITDASIIHKYNKHKLIKSITIDFLSKQKKLTKLNFIKIDVEGAEFLTLLGAKKSIAKFKPIIYLENNNELNFKKIYYFLKKNYNCYYFGLKGKLLKIKKFKKDNIIFIPKNKK